MIRSFRRCRMACERESFSAARHHFNEFSDYIKVYLSTRRNAEIFISQHTKRGCDRFAAAWTCAPHISSGKQGRSLARVKHRFLTLAAGFPQTEPYVCVKSTVCGNKKGLFIGRRSSPGTGCPAKPRKPRGFHIIQPGNTQKPTFLFGLFVLPDSSNKEEHDEQNS